MTLDLHHFSLRTRLVLLVAVLFAAFALFFLAFFPARMDAQASRWMLSRAMGIAQLLASATEPALDFGDVINGQRHLETLASTPEAVYGLLLREDGTPLAAWHPERAPGLLPQAPEGARIHGEQVVARVNIHTRGDQRGALVVGFSLAELQRESQDTLRLAAAVSTLILAFGVLAAFGIGTLLVRPLKRVTQVALRISEGDLNAQQELDLTRRDEPGTLAAALSKMLGRLYEQRALIESQSEASSEGILTIAESGVILAHNQRLLRMWHLGPERLEGRHVEELMRALAPAVEDPEALQHLARLQHEPPEGGPREFSLRDGRTLTVYRAPIQSREGTRFGWGLYFQDITERLAQERVRARNLELEQRVAERTQELAERLRELRTTQEQLIVADRRTSVGTLAAGVAHEINNPLAYVTSNVQFVLQELPGVKLALMPGCAPEQRAKLESCWKEMTSALVEAREGCSRVQHIVQSLKSFSRSEDDRCEPTELEHPLEAAINMASNELRHRARLVRDYGEVPPVEANEVRLAQVFLNLLINASHAIAPGAADQNEIRVCTRQGEDGRVRISISDTGSGMSPEVRSRLFTPFFTTKPVGVGTGLGLSVCQGIVTRFGGSISVESELNRGSTFTVSLPASTVPVKRPPQPQPPPRHDQRRGRVLVVDDDPFVGAALRRTLGRQHDVVVALGAREALALILQGSRFDLILCDVMMPEMTGVDFFNELQRVLPPQADVVTFFTGGAFTDATRAFLEKHPDRVLSKPLDAERLLERLFLQVERGTSSHAVVA